MLDLVVLRVKGDHIVILILPQERPGADAVPGAVFAQGHLFFDIPLKVFEADPAVLADGGVDLVHVVVDALVHGLHAAGDDDLALQVFGFMPAGKAGQLADQVRRLAVGDELGGLDGIHEELELGQFELAAAEAVVVIVAGMSGDDVHSETAKFLQILIERLAIRVDPGRGELGYEILYRQGMPVIRLF